MSNKSACFTGHRDIDPSRVPAIREKLREIIISCIEDGYTDFYNGGARGFDLMCAEEVMKLKGAYPDIRLHIIIPCSNQTRGWREEDVLRYERITSLADEVKCLSPFYFNGCMQIRNRYMVDNSSLVIAYLERATGGSAGTVRYAEEKGKEAVNIFDEI